LRLVAAGASSIGEAGIVAVGACAYSHKVAELS